MRNELSHIEKIEKYIAGSMTENERLDFELQLKLDTNLQTDLDLQQQLVKRLQLNAFKAEMMASHKALVGKSNWSWTSIILNLFLGLLIFVGSAVTTAFLLPSKTISEVKTNPETVNITSVDSSKIEPEVIVENQPEEVSNQELVSTSSSHKTNSKTNKIVKKPKIDLHKAFVQPFLSSTIDANLGGTIETIDSKSQLHFPANSMVTKDGREVNGIVEIRYREYRNPAQTAYSGIPMTYQENGLDYNFNSAGMIEVRAYQNGEELKMKPGTTFTMDYNVTEQLDSCFFFALNDSSKTWDKVNEIKFSPNKISKGTANSYFREGIEIPPLESEPGTGALTVLVADSLAPKDVYPISLKLVALNKSGVNCKVEWKTFDEENGYAKRYVLPNVTPGLYRAEISAKGYVKAEIDSLIIYENKISKLDVNLSGNRKSSRRAMKNGEEPGRMTYTLQDSVRQISSNIEIRKDEMIEFGKTDSAMRPELLRETRISPNLVQGLQCENFGVYNCDQIQKVSSRVSVMASYKDETGAPILDAYNLSMINYNYNASFGFTPGNFQFEKNGKTVLLLFTDQNKIYVLPASKFELMNISQNGNYTFEMTDVTDQVRNTGELKSYLGL